jgi:hypothetical protein
LPPLALEHPTNIMSESDASQRVEGCRMS